MKTGEQTRDVPPLSMRAALKSVNAEKRTVDVLWTTGAPVLRSSWSDGPFYEELSLDPAHVRMDRLTSGRAPLLDSHASYGGVGSVLGVVESARLEGDSGVATVRFPSEGISPEADKVFRLMADGIVRNVSVGYRTYKFEKVEGGEDKIPTFRACDWEPYEISAVAMGADADASFRSASTQLNQCVFITRGTAPQQESSTMSDNVKDTAPANDAARMAEVEKRAIQTERERVSGIQSAVRAAKLGDEFAAKLITDGVDLASARASVLEKLATESEKFRADPPALNVEVGQDSREKFMRGAEASLLSRFGLAPLVATMQARGHKAFKNVDTDAGELGGMRVARLAQEFLTRQGVDTRKLNDDQIVGRALTFTRGGESSASDFAVLLENVMYKSLLGNYALADDTWRQFCKVDSVQDFRPSNRYRTGSFGTLPVVPEGAEFTNEAIPDGSKTTLSVQTYGKMLALTRQALVNDDMGAILDTVGKFGRSAGLTIETAVYALLTANAGLGANLADSTAFFDASRSNLNGTGSALGVQGIDADRVILASQKDPSSNEFLNLAKYGSLTLLVPVGLGGLARNVNKSEWDITQSNKFQVPNIVQGLFGKVVDTPRLTGTRRYIFADPGDAAAIVVAFLNGQETPFMEQKLGWRVDGTEWKLRLDFGAQFFDPKGAVTNAGV
jgi:hypothetical protein